MSMREMENNNLVQTDAELMAVLNSINMKNMALDFVWQFEVDTKRGLAMCGGWFVRIAFERPDADSGIVGVGRGRWEFIEAGTSIPGVVKTCWLLMELIVRHELMEAFCWNGSRIFNPHNTVQQLASINS